MLTDEFGLIAGYYCINFWFHFAISWVRDKEYTGLKMMFGGEKGNIHLFHYFSAYGSNDNYSFCVNVKRFNLTLISFVSVLLLGVWFLQVS